VSIRPTDPVITVRQAFEAMRLFLEQFNEREPNERKETIEQLLRWTEIEADGDSSDPAQWHDWIGAVRTVLGDEPSEVSPLRATYDSAADAAYIYLTGRMLDPGRDSVPLDTPDDIPAIVVMDWKDGRIVGLEVLDAQALLHDDLVASAERLD